MKRVISTIVALGFISGMLVNSAYAGHRHIEVFNPLWVPVAILSTVAATVATIVQPPVIYEPQVYSEPRPTVIYEEPRNYRRDCNYDRAYEKPRHYRQVRYYDRNRAYDEQRYREYR